MEKKYWKLFVSAFQLTACTFGGALVTVLGTVLPPLVIISVISFSYRQFWDHVIVSMAMTGMLAGVAAVICDVVINMAQSVFRQKSWLPAVVLLASFLHVNSC